MPIVEKLIKALEVKYICDYKNCGGEMVYANRVLPNSPLLKYTHMCNKCNRIDAYDCIYPLLKKVESFNKSNRLLCA